MATQIKKSDFDLLVKNYKTQNRKIIILNRGQPPEVAAQPNNKSNFVQRWYFSLQGEDRPMFSEATFSQKKLNQQRIYRYDWAFGITLINNYWWNWQEELPEESAIAIHICLESDNDKSIAGAIPISATLSALHPSRNTSGNWETSMEVAKTLLKTSAPLIPGLKPISTLTSNLLNSYTGNNKNWFLYQFLDSELQCPTIEWRINKRVLEEYGPLLRGTLFLAFYGSESAKVRISLRPQIRFCKDSDMVFIIPTESDGFPMGNKVYIDVEPTATPASDTEQAASVSKKSRGTRHKLNVDKEA